MWIYCCHCCMDTHIASYITLYIQNYKSMGPLESLVYLQYNVQHGSDDCISLTTVNVKLQHAPLAASYLAAAVTSRCLGNCSRQKNKYFSSWCRKMRILENSCCRCAALQHCRCLGLDAFILTATDVQTLQHCRLLLHAPVPADIPFHLLKEWRLQIYCTCELSTIDYLLTVF